mmetsp:Transcript_11950/g.27936  ORF Transcript_11950/g.27936 Transcript_11950/m.27936 type:complete len:823 (+) Transcript_11950:95-2563(+)
MGLSQCVGWCSATLRQSQLTQLPHLPPIFSRLRDEDEDDRQGFVDLMNEIIRHQWPFMNEWFQVLMKAQVEPQLAKLSIQGFLDFRLGDTVTLGDKPFKLQVEKIDSFHQESTSAANPDEPPFQNMIVFCLLDWQGNAVVDIRMGGNVELTMHSIRMKGIMIVELVRMSSVPPWFSGIRMYMPDEPDLDMQVKSRIFGGVINFHGESVAIAVKKALLRSLSKQMVLPNCFATPVGDRIDTFNAKAIRPEGVLRIGLLTASGLHGSQKRTWSSTSSRRQKDPVVEVKISLGALKFDYPLSTMQEHPSWTDGAVPMWTDGAVMDFLVTRPNVQMARVTLKDESSLFKAEVMVSVTDLIERYGHNNPDKTPLMFVGDSGAMCFLHIATEWKVASHVEVPRPWSLGPSRDLTWVLVVDVFHATNLPREGHDVAHWVVTSFHRNQRGPKKQDSVKRMASELAWIEQTTQNCVAKTPGEQGLVLLRKLRLSADLQTVLGLDLEQADHPKTLALAERFWKERMKCRQSQESLAMQQEYYHNHNRIDLLDVAWDFPCYFHLDGNKCGRLSLNVYRRSSKGDASNKNPTFVGSAEIDIDTLRLALGRYTIVSAPLKGHDGSSMPPMLHFRISMKSLETSYRAVDPVTFHDKTFTAPAKRATLMAGLRDAAHWLKRQRSPLSPSSAPSAASSSAQMPAHRAWSSERPGDALLEGSHLAAPSYHSESAVQPPDEVGSAGSSRLGFSSLKRGSSPSAFSTLRSPRSPKPPGVAPPPDDAHSEAGSVGGRSTKAHGDSGGPNMVSPRRGFRTFIADNVQKAAASIDERARARRGA